MLAAICLNLFVAVLVGSSYEICQAAVEPPIEYIAALAHLGEAFSNLGFRV